MTLRRMDSNYFSNTTGTSIKAPIARLPTPTRNKLRSTQILTSLPQIVSELLQNSLDSGARQVEIGVDCEEWTCWVRDDGGGITKESMNILGLGSEAGRYGTSKVYSSDSLNAVSTFGFRGEALASAADISCLEISSRTSKSRGSWSTILKGGKSLYNGPSIRWRRESPGTVVCIRDAFYNLPIRRLSHPSPPKTLELIRKEIETYALVFPHVSFSLENTNNGGESSSKGKGRVTRIPKTQSALAAFRHIHGRALAQHVDEISSTFGDMKLEGFISLEGAHSKAYQFLYVNRHPIVVCDLHRIIDIRFSSSSFAKNAYDETGETGLPRSTIRRSPRKTERKPVYVLNLTIPPRDIDNTIEPAKAAVQFQNKDDVSAFISTVIRSFLIKHGFLSENEPDRRRTRSYEPPSPSKKRRVAAESDTLLGHLSRIPSPTFDAGVSQSEVIPLYIRKDDDPDDDNDDELVWKDPATGEAFIVDKRTGHSYPRRAATHAGPDDISVEPSRRWTIPQNANSNCVSMPDWIRTALQANETYAVTEVRIPSLSLSLDRSTSHDHLCNCSSPDQQITSDSLHVSTDPKNGSRRFHKVDLRNAQVIDQVDRKFIACLIDNGKSPGCNCDVEGGRALVLIDQHAADERVRVEQFLQELCSGFLRHRQGKRGGVSTKKLSPLVPILLTRREAQFLQRSSEVQDAFEGWGFRFGDLPQDSGCDSEKGSGDEYVQVLVRSVPELVGEKLLVGDELRELVKGFLAKLEEDASRYPLFSLQHMPEDVSADEDDYPWLKALRWCPRELLDLVNSKACRGAIMFNDSLTAVQCESLVRQLSGTAFPFQCAHGRPSMIPLANVGMQGDSGRRHGAKVPWTKFRT